MLEESRPGRSKERRAERDVAVDGIDELKTERQVTIGFGKS